MVVILNHRVFFETLNLKFLRSLHTFEFLCWERRIVISVYILLWLNLISLLFNLLVYFNIYDIIIQFINFLFLNQRFLSTNSWINLIWITRTPIRNILSFFIFFIYTVFFRYNFAISFLLNILFHSILPNIDWNEVASGFIVMFLDIE